MAELILLEDETILREELADYLGAQGHRVTAVGTIAEFRLAWAQRDYRLAIVDLGLPDGNGLDLIRSLREAGHQLGIVVLTARSKSRIEGFDCGADHFLSKPIRLDELNAVLNAMLRRLNDVPLSQNWVLDTARRILVTPDGLEIHLSNQDFLVLRTLMENAGHTISRREIITALGEDYLAYDQRRLDTQIRRLRQKAKEAGPHELPIQTVHGTGYGFGGDVRIRPGAGHDIATPTGSNDPEPAIQ